MSVTTCPSCSTTVPPGAVFCDNCGYDLRTVDSGGQQPIAPTYQVPQPAGDVNCPQCGHPNIAGSAFCENCGGSLSQAQAQEVYAPPVEPPPPAPPAYTPPPQPAPAPPQPAPQPPPPAPPPAPAPAPAPVPAPAGFVTGRLVIQGSNVSLDIPQGKQTVVIGREDPVSGIFPDIDLDQHGGQEAGVGRRHAQLIVQGGQVQVEDLDSVNGTVVNKQRLSPRQPQPIKDGDEVRLGKMVLIYHAS